jgi:IS605 OrfB family transposase
MKDSDCYNYLGNVSQQTMKAADNAFKAFFALLKLVKQGKYNKDAVKIPNYRPVDSLYKIEFNSPRDQKKHIEQGFYQLPMSRYLNTKFNKHKIKITVPKYLRDKNIKQIHIIPKSNGKYFESVFVFEDEVADILELDQTRALAIDFGVNNFATCATSTGESFIIDGKKIKSINQWYNKENARLSSIKDHQKLSKHNTNLQAQKSAKRNRQIQDFIYCSAKYIVNYCIEHQIGNIVVGWNDGFQDKVDLGKVNNQTFTMLPYGKFKGRLEYLCKLAEINYIKQEESYTSKASFFDQDEIPVWNSDNPSQGNFSGKRIYRGLYKRANNQTLNADVNGALNILRKSNVVDLSVLYSRGVVNTPLRIRLA